LLGWWTQPGPDEKPSLIPLLTPFPKALDQGRIHILRSNYYNVYHLLDMSKFLILCCWAWWASGLLHSIEGHLRSTANRSSDDTASSTSIHETRRLLDLNNKITQFQLAKAKMIEQLKIDYGEDVYSTVFEDDVVIYKGNETITQSGSTTSIGRNAFMQANNANIAWDRMKRKFMIRILRSQISNRRIPFVWATAGDQVAAGRGNFFAEQYTIVLQNTVEKVMAAAGIDLKTRPYGMGHSRSAPEIAACCKALFGEDVDLISWDFSTSDANHIWRLEFFAHRVMRMDNHPALLVLQADARRRVIVDHLAEQGMAILRQDRPYVVGRMLQFPDSRDKKAIAHATDHVKYFRCGIMVETGVGCMDHKFTHNGTCDDRGYQTQWHPGWKWHAFQGKLQALFLVEVLGDALEALKERQGEDPQTTLKELEALEEDEFKAFEASENFLYSKGWTEALANTDVTAHRLADSPVYCHTARLPAQARLMGYVTDNPFPDDLGDFDRGMDLEYGLNWKTDKMLLSYDKSHDESCPAILHIDYKDFHLATAGYDGYQDLLVPNDIEQEIYGGFDPLGIILVCGAGCGDSHACPPRSLGFEAITENKASARVNGEPVDHVISYQGCYLLVKKSGDLHWTADEEGKYTIGIDVTDPGKYIRIGSVIVW